MFESCHRNQRRHGRIMVAPLVENSSVYRLLFLMADFLSRPPGFYFVIVTMLVSTALVPFGLTEVVTYALSVAAIAITSVVLIQGYRDTAAIHAKLNEIVLSLRETRNEVVGLEHAEPEKIASEVERVEHEAEETGDAGQVNQVRARGS